jgi:putative transposase
MPTIQRWLKENGIKTIYIEPGCPWQNGYAESFNGRFRRACLNRELIYTLSEGRVVFEDWRRYYNQERPHRSLGLQTPAQFAKNQREQGSGSSRATPALHRNLEWKQNNKLKPPKTIPSQMA